MRHDGYGKLMGFKCWCEANKIAYIYSVEYLQEHTFFLEMIFDISDIPDISESFPFSRD